MKEKRDDIFDNEKYQKKTERKKRKYTVSEDVGRPRRELDRATVENMCSLFCTIDEISGVFGIGRMTLIRRVKEWAEEDRKKYGESSFDSFGTFFQIYSANGRVSLRRTQFEQAKTSVPMAIHLGKNYLGQRDIITTETKDGGLTDEERKRRQEELESVIPENVKTKEEIEAENVSDDK